MSDRNFSIHNYDFGDDADVELPNDPAFDAWISEKAPSLNAPPSSVPSAEMWNKISARAVTARAPNRFRWSRLFIPTALAAALVVGIGIDRMMTEKTSADRDLNKTVATGQQADSAQPTAENLYHLAAVQTLTQAEALLATYRSDAASPPDTQTTRQLNQWGRQVLSSTRLLLDSPAGNDPQLKPLLEDLEVVLVQIISLMGEPLDASERALIDGAIRSRHLLPRIRSAVPAGQHAASL